MAEINEKHTLILEHERQFANILASHVLDKPELSIWMIIIPIIFVFYFYKFQKFIDGRKTFAEHYLVSRKRALDEAVEVVSTGREPDIENLATLSDVPDSFRGQQAEVFAVLVEHFMKLLRLDGEDFASLVKSAYGDRMNYLLFLNRLNRAEKEVNTALEPHLQKTLEGVNSIMNTIELQSEKLRRENAERFFP